MVRRPLNAPQWKIWDWSRRRKIVFHKIHHILLKRFVTNETLHSDQSSNFNKCNWIIWDWFGRKISRSTDSSCKSCVWKSVDRLNNVWNRRIILNKSEELRSRKKSWRVQDIGEGLKNSVKLGNSQKNSRNFRGKNEHPLRYAASEAPSSFHTPTRKFRLHLLGK